MTEISAANEAACEAAVRREDPDRWLASLFIPAGQRGPVHALHAFSLEIARARTLVSEPLMGQIRHQWWRDAIENPDREDVAAHPVAAALTSAIRRFDLPREELIGLIDAREFDLFDEPMPSLDALEAYARATASSLFRLAPMILAPQTPSSGLGVAENAGVAYALTGLLRAFPWHAAQGQLYLPLDRLAAHGLSAAEALSGAASPQLGAVLAELRALARERLDTFMTRVDGLTEAAQTAFLPASLCEAYLKRMEEPGYDPFKTLIELPQWRRQWILWRAARRHRRQPS